MKYNCKYYDEYDGTLQEWVSEIQIIKKDEKIVEIKIIARSTSINIILGKSSTGNFIFIPNHDYGTYLSALGDTFWNCEKIQQEIGPIDAASIGYGVKYLESKGLIY